MKIREYLDRKGKTIRALSWLGFLLGLATIYFVGVKPDLIYRALFILTALILCIVIVLIRGLSCPRCGGSLFKIAPWIVFRRPPPVNACPNCGVKFAEPVPHKPGS